MLFVAYLLEILSSAMKLGEICRFAQHAHEDSTVDQGLFFCLSLRVGPRFNGLFTFASFPNAANLFMESDKI